MPKSKDLKELTKTWYKKLEDSGFNDIEQEDSVLKHHHGPWFHMMYDKDPNAVKHKVRYYRLAGFFLNEHKFAKLIHKAIWEYHAQGLGCREISSILEEKHKITIKKTAVNDITKALSRIMFQKYNGVEDEIE